MKEIVIKRITLSNWKAQNTDVEFDKEGNSIVGDNGKGKSTIQKGWNWLLTSMSDANTVKNSDLFDNKEALTNETPLASVKAVITIDGVEHTLERTARCKFVRKRGTDTYEKASSDEYKTYIDLVEYSATDFEQWVSANICQTNVLSYCLSGEFFLINCINDKKKMREFLRVVVGDVEDNELTGDYEELFKLLEEKKSIDIVEQCEKQKLANTKKSLDEKPTMIKNCEAEISRINSEYDFNDIKSKIIDKKEAIESIDNSILGFANSLKPYIDARNKAIAEKNHLKDLLSNAKAEYERTHASMRVQFEVALENAIKKNANVESRNEKLKAKRLSDENQLDGLKRQLEIYKQRKEVLLKQLSEVKEMVFTNDKCPMCGQLLPEDKLELSKAKFEEEKQSRYNKVVADGRGNNADIEYIENRIKDIEFSLKNDLELEKIEDITPYKEQLDAFDASIYPYEQMEEYDIMKKKIDSVVIPEIPENDSSKLTQKKESLMLELSELTMKYGVKDILEQKESELIVLKQEQRDLSSEIAEIEQILIQIKKYRQEKAEIISHRINGVLEYASIQMFSQQKDGTIIPDLIVKDKNGVSYSTTNGASRILMAVDMQRFFCEKSDVNIPIFIDESSVLTEHNLPKVNGTQMFYMFCKDCPLTIEKI